MLFRFMMRFSDWFASPSGVMQTFLVTLAIVIIERIWPNLDPNGFWFMYALTVYSAVTQPVLAFAASVSSEKATALQLKMQSLQESQYQMMKNQLDMMHAILAIAERLQSGMQQVQTDIEEIAEDIEEIAAEEHARD